LGLKEGVTGVELTGLVTSSFLFVMGRRRERPKHLAAKLLALRKALGLSQSQLARLIGVTGGTARISEYEHDVRVPDLATVLRYARLAQVRMEMLVDDDLELIIPERKKRIRR
jgi:transcriptional regulator with XRE-family HTH domain